MDYIGFKLDLKYIKLGCDFDVLLKAKRHCLNGLIFYFWFGVYFDFDQRQRCSYAKCTVCFLRKWHCFLLCDLLSHLSSAIVLASEARLDTCRLVYVRFVWVSGMLKRISN